MRTYLMENMTWPEIKDAVERGVNTVIVAAGSIEQHGPHLAQSTDTLLGYASSIDLAQRLGKTLVAPVIRPGLSSHHMALPGSLTLRPEVFAGLVEDYVHSYIHHGFQNIVLISAHGGNFHALEEIAEELQEKNPDVNIVTGASLSMVQKALGQMEQEENVPQGACGGHACDFETSVMLYFHEEHVRLDNVEKGFTGKLTPGLLKKLFQKGFTEISGNGILGDPRAAEAERGKRYFEKLQQVHMEAILEKLNQRK